HLVGIADDLPRAFDTRNGEAARQDSLMTGGAKPRRESRKLIGAARKRFARCALQAQVKLSQENVVALDSAERRHAEQRGEGRSQLALLQQVDVSLSPEELMLQLGQAFAAARERGVGTMVR